MPWFAILVVAGALAAAAAGFALADGADELKLPFPWARSGERADARAAQLASRSPAIPAPLRHGEAEEELLAEIRRVTARPPPAEVEHILALRRGGAPDPALVPLVDALLGDDPLVAASVKEWLRRTPRRTPPLVP